MSNDKKVIIIVVAALAIAAVVFFAVNSRKTITPPKAELEMWGAFDDSDIYGKLIDSFNVSYPYIQITYYKKNAQTYEKDLLEAMAIGRGPDLFVIHNSWLPRYENKVITAPEDLISLKSFQEGFVDVVVNDFAADGKISAVPLSVDTLALYYNKDIFNTLKIAEPPEDWDEFLNDVELITQKDERDNILRAGAAIGTARNINRSTDILSLLMLQSGAKMVDDDKRRAIFGNLISLGNKSFNPGERALQFYTDFANPLKPIYTWNTRMHYSIDAFYEGRLGMMFNYAYNIPIVRAKAPYLNFAVAEMPQPKDTEVAVNYANYWGVTVSSQSSHPREAWIFNAWLAQKENHKYYLELTKRPTARRDLVDWQRNDPDLGIFAVQSLTAQSWYQADNLAVETILADTIESVVLGQATIGDAISKAVNQISLLMR